MSNWWVQEYGFTGTLAGSNFGSGGNPNAAAATGALQFRSPVDRERAAGGKLSQAEYPDGYLGNIIDRRSDRLIQAVKNTLTARSYQRGVHKGSRIDPKDYLWPEGGVTPGAGLERQQATAAPAGNTTLVARFAPLGDPVERLAHMGKTAGMATPGDLGNKMAEARAYGVSPSMNPIIPPDPQLMMPRYRVGGPKISSLENHNAVRGYESGK
jgi:hypothetical protein